MKIEIVLGPFQELPPRGCGAVEKVWWDFARIFVRMGHAVRLVGKGDAGTAAPAAPGAVEVVPMRGFRATPWLPLNLVLDFLYTVGLRRRAHDCDVLVTNSFWAPVVLPLFRRRRAAMVVHVARFPKGQMGLYRGADALQAISSAVAREIGRQTPAVRDKVAVLPYPVDIEVFRPPAEGRRAAAAFTIVYAGRIHPEKGIHLLVQAFARVHARLPACRLRVIGPHAPEDGGGGEAYLEALRKAAAGVPVQFVRAIRDPRALAAEYASAHCFCYPSLAEKGEAFGLAILEAMAAGLPVVVSDLDCFRDFVTHGDEGFVFDHRGGDAAMRLSEALLALAEHPADALRIGRAGEARAREFELEAVALRYLRFFEQVRAGRPA